MYGFYFRLRPVTTTSLFEPLFIAFGHGMLVVVGKSPPYP